MTPYSPYLSIRHMHVAALLFFTRGAVSSFNLEGGRSHSAQHSPVVPLLDPGKESHNELLTSDQGPVEGYKSALLLDENNWILIL